jgi:hypothetical protein
MKQGTLDISNPYVRRARLQPAMLVALPLGLATLAISPGGIVGWGTVWSLFVFCGGTALMAQMARDLGKQKEPGLYQSWGGKPTTRLQRHRHTANATLLGRRHRQLQSLVPGIQIPTVADELADPRAADDVYDSCTAFLLEKTRKKENFPLVFEENCNYGFRRNLWGMKPLGVATSLIGTVAIAAALTMGYRNGVLPSPVPLACGILSLLLFISWLFWFTPTWVKIAADAYAEKLLASCESL